MPKHHKNGDVKNETSTGAENGAKKPPKKSQKQPSKKTKKTTNQNSKKRGCPSEYANKVKPYLADIARYTRCGVTEGQLCEYYDVGKTSWAKYKKENPELAETLFKAKQEFKTDLINKSFTVAMGYDYEEETTVTTKDTNGNITGTKTTKHRRHAKADAGMIQFLLINRFKEEFARDPQIIALRKKALELAEKGKIPPDTEGI